MPPVKRLYFGIYCFLCIGSWPFRYLMITSKRRKRVPLQIFGSIQKCFQHFREKKDHQNLISNRHDNHEYLYDTSQTRAQWDPSVWSWLMGSLHMYPFRINGSYLVIFCHMYTTHSRLNVSKSSYRIIISSQMGSIWP